MADQRMEDSWARVKSQITNMWGDIDEKDLKKARGSLRKMVDLIHEKTGEDQGLIMRKMSAII